MGEANNEIPIWHKFALTVQEAAVYFGIGEKKLRELSEADHCAFVLWVGNKRLLKRALLEQYLASEFSI